MGLLDDCESLFETRDLYKMLSIDTKATEADIKRAYKKCALLVHPDRQQNKKDKEISKKKFQTLSAVTKILLDADLRAIYDEQGIVDEESSISGVKNWETYFENLFPKLTVESLRKFYEDYQDSEIESKDLKEVYLKAKGDMDLIMEMQIGRDSIKDEPRFRKILENAIKNSEVPEFEIFVNEPKAKKAKRIRFYKKEAKEVEAEQKAKASSRSSEEDLIMMLQKNNKTRQKEHEEFIKELEAKYTKPKPAKRAKK